MSNTHLKAASELAAKRTPRFPGETAAYANARESLLAEEIELRRHMTRVSEKRMALPPGPLVQKDYRFKDENGAEVGLTDLFGIHKTLITYFWMYGPQRDRPCPMCTNWLGGVNGNAIDLKQRVALKILGRSSIERQKAFAAERGWRNLDFLQTVGDSYAHDLNLLTADGGESPSLVVYQRDGETVRVFYAAEMPAEAADPGQDPRVAPDIAPLWNLLDLTPDGRGNWYPKLSY
jgi:predicted dithiol-disulfide oxidoreductase (DUF899 family)